MPHTEGTNEFIKSVLGYEEHDEHLKAEYDLECRHDMLMEFAVKNADLFLEFANASTEYTNSNFVKQFKRSYTQK
ncbi:hypothetical protein [Paenibacillus sp. NPDC055715]